MGAFAGESLDEGSFVGEYVGTLSTSEETTRRYGGGSGDYVFRLCAGRTIDAQNSTHFSRFFNHAQRAAGPAAAPAAAWIPPKGRRADHRRRQQAET